MRDFFEKFDKVMIRAEELITALLLITIATFVFVAAITRRFGFPLNWTQDVSLLEFAWLTFLGSDLLLRTSKLITIDLIFDNLPKSVKKVLQILFDCGMIVFLFVLTRYGFPLVSQSWSRVFNTLPMSYAWCTLSVPVGSLLMLETVIEKTVRDLARPVSGYAKEPKNA